MHGETVKLSLNVFDIYGIITGKRIPHDTCVL